MALSTLFRRLPGLRLAGDAAIQQCLPFPRAGAAGRRAGELSPACASTSGMQLRQSPRRCQARAGRSVGGLAVHATPPPPAASKPGMPCASRPPAMPASTSPEPAVPRLGGALELIAARPSGAAITVSAALEDDDGAGALGRGARLLELAARRARRTGARTRPHAASAPPADPGAALIAANSVSGSSLNASSHRHRARRPAPAARTSSTLSRVGVADAGGRADDHGMPCRRRESRKLVAASANGFSMMAVTCAAWTSSASRSPTRVTSPAPARNAAVAAEPRGAGLQRRRRRRPRNGRACICGPRRPSAAATRAAGRSPRPAARCRRAPRRECRYGRGRSRRRARGRETADGPASCGRR